MAPRKDYCGVKSIKRCAVPFCTEIDADCLFQFPKNDDTGKKWINAINNVELIELDEENGYNFIYTKRYRVCSRHFDQRFISKDKNGRRMLAKNAIPCFSLSEKYVPVTFHYSIYVNESFYPKIFFRFACNN